ncbi:restriction endonuclease, SacI family [Arthrobacter sp. zg-Y844]|uniref:restriction endonuclease, SacI family n=1 Tax=Arthrobacter sp. zg-Y844 TaxID=2964612 RepID=UPI00210730B5|nr:restriction endonuclease, SacI family [Arthrobacter sp. zg-Y844]MCQ1987536.1 restriction endonuclease, SacI family [Arthrobacter sp. zg-Y844]
MPISIDYEAAQEVLLEAVTIAKSDTRLPVEWKSHARAVFELEAKTWTPAFATLLLAKATDDRIDTMSLKAEEGNAEAYSARGLCHKVLVPAAVEHNFSIRNTGREPLNNQPFFRYDRIDKIDRVRRPADKEYFVAVVEQANKLTGRLALQALAAFVREAFSVTAAAQKVVVKTNGLTAHGVRIAVEDFLRIDARDRPHRLQAFAAACLDLLYEDVKTRRINDPSRDLPGDVHALLGGTVAVAMEVRGKAVTASDLSTFAQACEAAGLNRGVMFVDAPQQIRLEIHVGINNHSRITQVAAFTSAARLLGDALLWANSPLENAIDSFSKAFLVRLREIEVTLPTLQEWSRAVAVAQGR